MDAEREARQDELASTPDDDVPQDPGVPGVKLPADEPGQGVGPESDPADDEGRARAAEADDTLAPGSMPPREPRPDPGP